MYLQASIVLLAGSHNAQPGQGYSLHWGLHRAAGLHRAGGYVRGSSPRLLCYFLSRLDLRDIKVVTKLGGTVDDSELVDGMVFDQKAAKTAGGPTRMEKAKIGLVQFHLSPPKADIENNIIISDYTQVGRCVLSCMAGGELGSADCCCHSPLAPIAALAVPVHDSCLTCSHLFCCSWALMNVRIKMHLST